MKRRLGPWFPLLFALGVSAAEGGCELGRQVVDELPPPGEPSSCVAKPCAFPIVPFELPPFMDPEQCADPGACAEVSWESASASARLNGNVLKVSTLAPMTLELREISLVGSALFLSGPVTLRIKDSDLRGVVVWFSAPEGIASPRLIVEQSQVEALTARSDGSAGLVGTLQLERVLGRAFDLAVASIVVDSSNMQGARLVSRDLRVTYTRLQTVELSFDEGYLSDANANDLRTLDCGDLALTGSSIGGDTSELGPCRELLLSRSSMVLGIIDGPIHMERSRLSWVVVGMRVPTSLDGWEGGIDSVAFCAHTEAVRLDPEIMVSCASCENAPAMSSCYLNASPLLLGNHCPSLQDQLKRCPEPLPHTVEVR